VFQQILNEKRLHRINKSNKKVKETLLFCFTHAKQGKIYFYSATLEELNARPEFKSVFLAFGSQKDSWRVFKLQLLEASDEDAHLPLTIPDTASEEIKKSKQTSLSKGTGSS
jgi:hypothetical protein